MSKISILHEKCDRELAGDKSLPYTAYLIEYVVDGVTQYDITTAPKQVDIFDHYWDLHHDQFKNMTQTEGRIDPRLYGSRNKKKK